MHIKKELRRFLILVTLFFLSACGNDHRTDVTTESSACKKDNKCDGDLSSGNPPTPALSSAKHIKSDSGENDESEDNQHENDDENNPTEDDQHGLDETSSSIDESGCSDSSSSGMLEITQYDVSADFSYDHNPSIQWSYGWSSAEQTNFQLMMYRTQRYGLNIWGGMSGSDRFNNPSVSYNPSASSVVVDQTSWPSGAVSLHPGPSGQMAVVRWIAPASGFATLSADFQGLDHGVGASTNVVIRHNGSILFEGEVYGSSPETGQHAKFMRPVEMWDTIDFMVGMGNNGTYNSDSTLLQAQIMFCRAEQ